MRRNAGLLFHAVGITIMVLLCRRAAGGEENVLVLRPITKFVSSRADLHAACGVTGHYDACSRMIAYRLEATCAGDGTEWRMQASATFRPWIVLHRPRSLFHEYLHIEDIRVAVERHILGLEALRFSSREDCQAQTRAASSGFANAMVQFARDSNRARHPLLPRLTGN